MVPSVGFYQVLQKAVQSVVALVVAMSMAGPATAQIARMEEVAIPEGRFNSSTVCGACHQDIYKSWSEGSIHSKSMSDPNFQGALGHVDLDDQNGCLMCHAPTTVVTGDKEQAMSLTHEGVTCDFCHSLKDVDLSADVPFVLDVGPRKRGPLEDARMAPHETVASDLHTSSLLCASCHEFTNRHGIKVLSTYSDWLAGPYPATWDKVKPVVQFGAKHDVFTSDICGELEIVESEIVACRPLLERRSTERNRTPLEEAAEHKQDVVRLIGKLSL